MADGFSEISAKPHYAGHRKRLRERFMQGGADALPDYELLELLLFRAMPQRDMKPLAKSLIDRFGSFADVISADPARLREIKGVGDSIITEFKIVQTAALRLSRAKVMQRPVLSSWSKLLDYCSASMSYLQKEQFRILFMDRKNALIADEVQHEGTIDHTPVYPREVIKRALELGASAIILVHNHPSGDATPSRADIEMTKRIVEAAEKLNIVVHDHIIIGREHHASFRGMKLI